ncbi:alginate O-acetyltransferase AlgX-related protein [Legionella sp. D16C41]|uniref:alginate O-acetyltransferase AlgX-related protein n=1 Tax=Legionella sp. D16C41 TaxID=3402688 RepID=UPI003AF7708A
MKTTDKLLILAFIIFIFTPGIGLFLKKDPNEIRTALNREPNSFPAVNFKRLGKTNFKGIESWFADQALLVTSFSKFWSDFNYSLGVSSKPKDTIIGKNGWLFLGNFYNSPLDQYTGKLPPTSAEINSTSNSIKRLYNVAQQNNIPFLVTIAPDKQTIYPEFLPSYLKKTTLPTRYDLIMEQLKANHIDFIDLEEVELKAKNTLGQKYGDIYLKCDSHWNMLGAYAAYQAIANYIIKLGIQINKINYDFIPGKNKRGDLSHFIQITTCESNHPLPDTSTLAIDWWEKDESGKHKLTPFTYSSKNGLLMPHEVINKSVKNNLTALVIGDSFLESLMFYFRNNFHNTIRVHVSNRNIKLTELINRYHPDIIIFELVERSLMNFYTEL